MSRLVYERKSQMIPRPSCYCCKLPMVIERNKSHEDILYFDKHFYHRDCYLGMKKIRKKCYCCSEEMELEQNDANVLIYKQHYYHKNCFVNWCNEKKTVARKNASANIEKYVDAATTAVQELFEKKKCDSSSIAILQKQAEKRISDWFIGSDLCAFIRNEYDITEVPWTRIKEVIDGTSYRTETPIPAEDLLDMWERKIDVLRKANQKKLSKQGADDKVTPEMLIGYDMTILVNKYNSYLNWKEKQKILAAEKEHEKTENIVSQAITHGRSVENHKEESKKSNDINDLLDEIFG